MKTPLFIPIGKIAEIRAGYQYRPTDEVDENGEFLLIQQKDVLPDRTGITFSKAERINPNREYSKQLLTEGDVLFMGKGRYPFGCAVTQPPAQTIASGAFFILHPDTARILPEYLAWIINLKQTRHELHTAAGAGVAMPVVRRKELEEQPIPLPPLSIQQKIVELHRLMAEEQSLMRKLAKQKEILNRGICQKLISGTAMEETT